MKQVIILYQPLKTFFFLLQITFSSAENRPVRYLYLLLKLILLGFTLSIISVSEVSNQSNNMNDMSKARVVNVLILYIITILKVKRNANTPNLFKFFFKVFFEKIFVTHPWKALFVSSDDDIGEWWRKWKLDRYRYIIINDTMILYHTKWDQVQG